MDLTILDFSKMTGLPPSRLRFYDKKGILKPSTRLDNGYRVYSVDQIHTAKMIDSLRQANITIQDIKRYHEVNLDEKNAMLKRWSLDLDQKLEVLKAARKYVGGLKAEESPTILLTKWERPKLFIWQNFEVDRKPHPFRECFEITKKTIEDYGIRHSMEVFVRTKQIDGNRIAGEVGFEILDSFEVKEIEGIDNLYAEQISPTLFAIMQDCHADDALLCFSYLQMVIRYGFQPAADKLERYATTEGNTFDYLIPLVM